MNKRPPIVFTGSSHPELGASICHELGVSPGGLESRHFLDGEIYINIKEDVTDRNVFVVQSGQHPSADHLLELCFIIRSIQDNNPRSITAVLPFTCYRRQERKTKPGETVSAEMAIQMIELAGATHAIAVDLHATTNETFFTIPLTHIHAWNILADALHNEITDLSKLTITAPDEGSRRFASSIAHKLDAPIAIMDKQRPNHDRAVITEFAGDVDGRDVVIADDEICSAGTLIAAAEHLQNIGAKRILCAATHSILAGNASELLQDSHIEKIFTTDTIPQPKEAIPQKLHILSIAPHIAKAIQEHK